MEIWCPTHEVVENVKFLGELTVTLACGVVLMDGEQVAPNRRTSYVNWN